MVKFASYNYKALLIATKKKKSVRSDALLNDYHFATYMVEGSNCLTIHIEKSYKTHSS